MQRDIPGVLVWPPVLYGGAAIALLALDWLVPWPLAGHPAALWAGVLLLALGVAFNVWGSLVMRKGGTNINPALPTKALVLSGPFRLSRNPLYVAASVMFLGLTLIVDSVWGLLILVPVLAVMHFGVILREERYLEDKFGESYRRYQATVRRYL